MRVTRVTRQSYNAKILSHLRTKFIGIRLVWSFPSDQMILGIANTRIISVGLNTLLSFFRNAIIEDEVGVQLDSKFKNNSIRASSTLICKCGWCLKSRVSRLCSSLEKTKDSPSWINFFQEDSSSQLYIFVQSRSACDFRLFVIFHYPTSFCLIIPWNIPLQLFHEKPWNSTLIN